MGGAPRIRVLTTRLGLFPSVGSLNPSLGPDRWTIRLQLEVEWAPADPLRSLMLLEEGLLDVCPSLSAHRCGGPAEYHVRSFVQGGQGAREVRAGVEPALALVHLIEHVMIDAIAFVTAASSVSGATGARRESSNRFDVFVECRDPAVGALARHLGVTWTTALIRGGDLTRRDARILHVARSLYRGGAAPFEADRVAAEVGLGPGETRTLLAELESAGFASRAAYTMNFSGVSYYGLSQS